MPEPEEDLETSLVVSTVSLILTLPLEIVIVAVFAAFIVRPTKGAKRGTRERWGGFTGIHSTMRSTKNVFYTSPGVRNTRQQFPRVS